MGEITLVTGGARSGKSAFAESLLDTEAKLIILQRIARLKILKWLTEYLSINSDVLKLANHRNVFSCLRRNRTSTSVSAFIGLRDYAID